MEGTASAPLRLYGWLDERFPPVAYTVLVLLFHGSAIAVAGALGGGGNLAIPAAFVVWLAFLHLRIFDEHKDYAKDVLAYPDRVLSRGIVTLPMLARLGGIAILAEAILSASLGAPALASWLLVLLFSVAMRFEFGVGAWLERHILAYAITHNPIVALLAFFLHAASGATWNPAYVAYIAMVSLGSLGFEIGRKARRPDEEHPGVPSYTSELGQRGARGVLGAVHLGTAICLALTLSSLGVSPIAAVLLAAGAVSPGFATLTGRAKRIELGATLSLLLSLLLAAIVAAVSS